MRTGSRPSILCAEIRRVVKASSVPLTRDDIGSRVKAAAGRSRLAKTVSNMLARGELLSARNGAIVRYSAGPKLTPGGVT